MGSAEDIGLFLQTSGLGTLGSTLFVHYWGKNQGNGILVTQIPAGPPKRFLGSNDTIKESSITVLIRNTNIETAISNANSVYSYLDNATIAGYISCLCDQSEPVCLDKEETEAGIMYYYSVNVKVQYV